jgi:hypothetical protein
MALHWRMVFGKLTIHFSQKFPLMPALLVMAMVWIVSPEMSE